MKIKMQKSGIKMTIQNVKLNTRNISQNNSFGLLHYILTFNF